MIESREQRRKSTLLHRRKVAIIVFVLVFVALAVTLTLLYHFFNTVFYFRDYDETIYYVKRVDGVFRMYNKDGNELPKDVPLGTEEELYITPYNTWVEVNPKTGNTTIRGIPDLHYHEDGEHAQGDYLIVFQYIERDRIKEITVKNTYGTYSVSGADDDNDGDIDSFVINEAPFISVDQSAMSYLVDNAGQIVANKRLPVEKDENGKVTYDPAEHLEDYGLTEQVRFDSEGNPYNYSPSYYVITTTSGEKHKIIIGDSLLDKSGYYLQYQNPNGKTRPAVYVLTPADLSSVDEKMTYEYTILGPAKNYLVPALVYAQDENTFYDVHDFSISQKGKDVPIIDFSYVDLEDRTGTVLGAHPYVFNATSFSSYNPNHDNIDSMLLALASPDIKDIAVINPTDAEKAAYGLMSLKVDENGEPILDKNGHKQYYYDSEYLIKFDKYVTDDVTGTTFKITERIYISAMNENGNYYTYTIINLPPDSLVSEDSIAAITIDIINEVSQSTLNFLKWDSYKWVYQSFMQSNIAYITDIEMSYGDYNVGFELNHGKEGDQTTLEVIANDTKGASLNTFALLKFTDKEGYKWVVTPQRIYVYNPDGSEAKPASRHFEYNTLDEQVHVINSYRQTEGGDKVYITADYITIVRANGKTEKMLRYHTTIFRLLYSNINSMRLVDSYTISEEEEAAIIGNKDNLLLTIKITDNTGKVKTCQFYKITERKAYVVVDGQGGFYVQTIKLQKLINDVSRFLSGEIIDKEALK